jgi:glycolate oxidase
MQTATKAALNAEHISLFKKIVGAGYVWFDEETLQHYAHDET